MNYLKPISPILILMLLSSCFSPAQAQEVPKSLEPVSPILSLGSKVINALYSAGGGTLYVCVDFFISSCYDVMDLISLLMGVWGVISSCINVVLAIVGIVTAMCFAIPFCGGIPSMCVSIFCNVPLSCISLCTTSVGFLMDLLRRVLEGAEVLNERFGGVA